MNREVDLVVAMKPPDIGKSRLRHGAALVSGATHADLVLAMAADTIAAATAAAGVRKVLVVATEPTALTELRAIGADVIAEGPHSGLNAALSHGQRLLSARDPGARIGALQADLPALRPDELTAALCSAGPHRAFVADRHGTGTTLLLAPAGRALDPAFGRDSAQTHRASGATALPAPLASLRCDVDTPADLRQARLIGLGKRTATVLGDTRARACS